MCFFARNSALAKIFGLAKISNFAEFTKFSLNLRNAQDPAATVSLLHASCILLPASLFFYFLLFFPSSP